MKFKETELKYISLVELISNCPDYHIDNIEKIPNIKELKYFFFVMIFVSGYFVLFIKRFLLANKKGTF